MAKSAVDNVRYLDQTQPHTVFLIACELRMVFRVKRVSKNTKKKDYVTETLCGPQSLKCLLSGSSQKTSAHRWSE